MDRTDPLDRNIAALRHAVERHLRRGGADEGVANHRVGDDFSLSHASPVEAEAAPSTVSAQGWIARLFGFGDR